MILLHQVDVVCINNNACQQQVKHVLLCPILKSRNAEKSIQLISKQNIAFTKHIGKHYTHKNLPTKCCKYLHFDVASNFSLFFFLRHFQGLKNRPSALNLLFRSSGGVRTPDPKLFVRRAAPFCFLAENKKKTTALAYIYIGILIWKKKKNYKWIVKYKKTSADCR